MITEFERHQGNDLLFVQLQHCKEVECKHLMAIYTTKGIYIYISQMNVFTMKQLQKHMDSQS